MEKTRKITQYRERLDKTLASPNLSNTEALKTLVKNQLIQSSENGIEGCSENIIEDKTAEVSNLLDMMRSASTVEGKKLNSCETTADPEWKLKQDNEELRVMYREGPQGTPFHMLLAEGYVDGPADVCLCISWESELYKKWWPQSTVPTFKILSAKCVEKVRIGEQISLVRMKVPWPLSAREAVVHYFMFEYFQEDLIVVLLKSISDLESIDGAKDAVRIDLVGGFALQKVNKERSYFRTIASMDIKMDFVPPSLINFISRQLIGNGFKLYQKVVCSTANSDEDYSKALSGPLYTKIREALFKLNESNNALDENKLDTDTSNLPEEPEMRNKMKGLDLVDMDQKVENDDPESEAAPDDAQVHLASEVAPDGAQFTGRSTFGEIEEVESDESGKLEGQIESDESEKIEDQVSNRVEETGCSNGKRNVVISSEVEQALEMLEKVISKVRQNGLNARIRSSSDFIQEVPRNENGGVYPKENDGVEAKSLEVGVCASDEHFIDVPLTDLVEKALPKSVKNPSVLHSTSYAGSNSLSKEINHNRIVPTSLEQELFVSCESDQAAFYSSKDGTAEVTVLDHILHDTNHINSKTNGTHEIAQGRMKKSRKHRKHRYCCFGLNSRQVDFEEVGRS